MRVICKRDRYRYIRLSLRFVNPQFSINHNTNFCVDTGAPYSVISYERVIEWNIDLAQLEASDTHRIGGVEARGHLLRNSRMVLRDSQGQLHPIDVPQIVILGRPFKRTGMPVPSLLGDDILRRFTLIVNSDQHGGNIIITDERVL